MFLSTSKEHSRNDYWVTEDSLIANSLHSFWCCSSSYPLTYSSRPEFRFWLLMWRRFIALGFIFHIFQLLTIRHLLVVYNMAQYFRYPFIYPFVY